ncbi:hypothetical protein FRC15_004116 [Serendipita sp. 397]|nr:hypothetical protein FRC15_004116 [Serendipita sp. 397]
MCTSLKASMEFNVKKSKEDKAKGKQPKHLLEYFHSIHTLPMAVSTYLHSPIHWLYIVLVASGMSFPWLLIIILPQSHSSCVTSTQLPTIHIFFLLHQIAMASDSICHNIQLLSTSGWTTWSFQVHGELTSKQVWGIVNETRSKPATIDVETFAKWTVDTECTAGVIMRYARTNAATHLTDLEDPVEMWKQLKAAYNAPVPGACFVALRALLSACQMPEEMLDQLATCIQELHQCFIGLQTTEFT